MEKLPYKKRMRSVKVPEILIGVKIGDESKVYSFKFLESYPSPEPIPPYTTGEESADIFEGGEGVEFDWWIDSAKGYKIT